MRQLNKKISLLGERQSWSSLGNTDLSKLTVLYETKANPFIFNRANPYFYHILLFMGGCALIKLYNYVTAIDEKVWVCIKHKSRRLVGIIKVETSGI